MTKCLFVMEDWPITPMAAGGASALIYSHLELMFNAVEEIELVILKKNHSLGFDNYRKSQPEIWEHVSSWCRKVHIIEIKSDGKKTNRFAKLVKSFTNPALFSYDDLIFSQGMQELIRLTRSVRPDLLWAEHLIPATLLAQGSFVCPLVYSHHDWYWKIKSHRAGNKRLDVRQTLRFWFSKRHETQLMHKAVGCVSGSQTELDEMRTLGAKELGYFPTTYDPVDNIGTTQVPDLPRIVHLGGMQTTANRLGLQRFLEVCWPVLKETISPELWVIGNLDGATPELLKNLAQDNIICTGVIPDLGSVLRPFDIHIIPWEHDTGTRTRIPLILNYSQVLVATRAAASCLSELRNRQNCMLVENLTEITSVILLLYTDSAERHRIAIKGHETFMEAYIQEAQQIRFNMFIQNIKQ